MLAAVTRKSSMDVSESITARFAVGRSSCEKSMVKLALMPPGTGGAAADTTMHMNIAITIQDADIST